MKRTIARSAGYLSRHLLRFQYGRYPLAHVLMQYGPKKDIEYKDQWGFNSAATPTDQMEMYRFVGVRVLPKSTMRHIRRGDWVIDAGANVGSVTAQLCHAVGPKGKVWAIEPIPRNIERLEQLKQQNALDRLTIYPGAVGSTAGTASIQLPASGNSGHASFTKSWNMAGRVEVTTWRLDDLVFGSENDRPLAFLKLDVEGFEPQVLEGAARTLQEMKPLVSCEFNDGLLRDAGSSSAKLLTQFAGLGYSPVGAPFEFTDKVVDLLLVHR